MSNNALEISAPLKRPIKTGAQYTRLMPRVSCEATNLGDGSNNTIEGVEFMAQWIRKYAFQTKKLTATLLREGKISQTNLSKTAQGIYEFLYNHIQYTADGALQQLRSPACAWAQRKKGVDCKSYTIFTMAMLQNLGITAAIRQVKQPGFYPEQFTHVYVVIPENQNSKKINGKYHVVDATKHQNTEGAFIENKNKIMSGLQYQGLNAPVASASKSWADFYFGLLNKGVSAHTIRALKHEIEKYTNAGISPSVSVFKNGVSVNGKRFYYKENTIGLGKSGGGSSSGGSSSGGSSSGGSGSGDTWGEIWGIVVEIFGGIDFGRIDCWGGSAYSGGEAKKDRQIMGDMYRAQFKRVKDALFSGNYAQLGREYAKLEAIEAIWWKVYSYLSEYLRGKRNSCTMDNVRGTRDFILELGRNRKAVRDNILYKDFNRVKVGTVTKSFGETSKELWPIVEDPMKHTVPLWKFTLKAGVDPNYEGGVGDYNPGNNNTGGNYNPGNTDTGGNYNPGNNNNTKTTSSNTLLYGGLAIGALVLAWPTLSKAINAVPAKPTAKKTAKPTTKKTSKKA